MRSDDLEFIEAATGAAIQNDGRSRGERHGSGASGRGGVCREGAADRRSARVADRLPLRGRGGAERFNGINMAGTEAIGDRESRTLADIPCAVIECVAVGRGFTAEDDAVTPEHGEVVEVGDSLEEVAAVTGLEGHGVARAVVDLRSVKLRRDLHRVERAIGDRHRDRDGCGIPHIVDRAAAAPETDPALARGGVGQRTGEEDFLYIHHPGWLG